MFSKPPIITDMGMTLLVRAAGGEQITFTKFQAGDGILTGDETMRTMTALKNPILTNIQITKAEDTEEQGYVQLSASFNNQTDIQESFRWTELGLIAEDEDGVEYLYAYGYDNEYAELINAGGSSVVLEQNISAIIAIGESENITANVLPAATYAGREEFLDHKNDEENPHNVTYSQTGAAAAVHTHSAANVTSGILPASRGGTGVNSVDALKALVAPNYVIGYYKGDNTQRKDIVLGFKPSPVFFCPTAEGYTAEQYQFNFQHIEPGKNIYPSRLPGVCLTEDADTLLSRGLGGAAITDTGFAVGWARDGYIQANNSLTFIYIAFR